MNTKSVAIMVYGGVDSDRNALSEEKYKDLASAFLSQGFEVSSVLYNDESADGLAVKLLEFDAVLVWVNPIEQGRDRKRLDELLVEISEKGCFVSTHPDVILKIGTKDVLYKTREMDWGGDTRIYTSYEDFIARFPESLKTSKIRVLKQHRGNGGNGVFKITYGASGKDVTVVHAKGNEERILPYEDFYGEFKPFFVNDGVLLDQEWNNNITNGMIRCYLTGTKVSGFGYQEINALYQSGDNASVPPSRRYYFTENCGLFSDLKDVMENTWVPELQSSLSITENMMPVIWDADFFINEANSKSALGKYSLCEINVSCVSPFPPSSIRFIVDEVRNRIEHA